MFLIGLAGWLVIAGLYVGLLTGVHIALLVAAVRKFCGSLCRVMAALCIGMTLAPPACLYLYVPRVSDYEYSQTTDLDQLRIVESFGAAFFGPLASGLTVGWALHWAVCAVWSRRKRGQVEATS